jgi:tRNA A-37 threonylcarbamoyl transferase component Bud32
MDEPRTERIDFQGRAAWRKRYGAPERRARVAALRWVARRLGANPLIAPLPLEAEQACREREMIARLDRLGVRVPEVLAAESTELVLSDLGPTLAIRCKCEPDPDRRAALVRSGFEALRELHARGGYLSQAFARNMAITPEGIGFIDLEEDPGTMMSLPAAQARDVLLYVHSTARFLADRPGRYVELLRAQVAAESPEVRAEISRVARRFRWLAPLAVLGGGRGRALAQALRTLAKVGVLAWWLLLFGERADDVGLALIDLMF